MTGIATYLVIFVAGPAIYWMLARRRPGRPYFVLLLALVAVLIVVAFGTAQTMVPAFSPSPYPGLGVILALWLAWIAIIALCFQAVQSRLTTHRAYRIAFTLGAMATTLPWFGLYAAQVITDR